MSFAHDTELALVSAAALVNSASEQDRLATPEELTRFLDDERWFGTRAGDRAELDAVRALRVRLRELWRLEESELVQALNEVLRDAAALPQLVDHDGLGWHIHAVAMDAPLSVRMAVEAAMALLDVVRSGELQRLKTCAAPDCSDVVVDLSRNRSRRFCESGCGNRQNVRDYRERRRT